MELLNLTYISTVIILLAAITELLRRRVLQEKFAIVWLAMGIALIFGAIFPKQVNEVSRFLGFQFLSNFVLFIFVLINLFILMQLSLSISKSENQVQTLAEEVAILRSELERNN